MEKVSSESEKMNDTHPSIQIKYDAMMARLSPGERAIMGCSVHDFSKEIALSQIASPQKSRARTMEELFTRFYRSDFPETGEASERALDAIRRYHAAAQFTEVSNEQERGPAPRTPSQGFPSAC